MKRDMLTYFSGKIIPALVNLAIIILALRYLGADQYGKYSLLFYASMLVNTLTFGWIQQSILRFLSSYTQELNQAINRFYYLSLISALSAAIIVFFLSVFYFHLSWFEIFIVLFYAFMYNMFMFHLTVNMAKLKPIKYAIMESSYNLIYLLVFLGMTIFLKEHIFIILFIAMGVSLILTEGIRIFLIPGGKHGIEINEFHWDSGFTQKVFNFGFVITLWLFLSYILNIADRFIIKEFGTYAEVGVYSAIKDLITKIATFTTMPIILAYHPKIMETWNNQRKEEAVKLIKEAMLFLVLVFVVVFACFMISKDFLYQRVLNLKSGGLWVVSISLAFNAFLWQAALLAHKPLELLFKQRLMLKLIIVCLILNVISNLIFVPRFGFISSAIIAFCSSLLYILLVIFLSYRMFQKSRGT